jgi:hypothetical protein
MLYIKELLYEGACWWGYILDWLVLYFFIDSRKKKGGGGEQVMNAWDVS